MTSYMQSWRAPQPSPSASRSPQLGLGSKVLVLSPAQQVVRAHPKPGSPAQWRRLVNCMHSHHLHQAEMMPIFASPLLQCSILRHFLSQRQSTILGPHFLPIILHLDAAFMQQTKSSHLGCTRHPYVASSANVDLPCRRSFIAV